MQEAFLRTSLPFIWVEDFCNNLHLGGSLHKEDFYLIIGRDGKYIKDRDGEVLKHKIWVVESQYGGCGSKPIATTQEN